MADEYQGFWQPIPPAGQDEVENDQNGIKCKFGRFGQSPATYVNKTTILCLTPNISEDPDDISEETVPVTVAMNGVDFNDDYSDVQFTFIGTGSSMSMWVVILGTIIFGLLIVSVWFFLSALSELLRARRQEASLNPYIEQTQLGPQPRNSTSRAAGGRSSRANLGGVGGSRASRAGSVAYGRLSRAQQRSRGQDNQSNYLR